MPSLRPERDRRAQPPDRQKAGARWRLWKVWMERLARHLAARRHARDLTEMTDRMRADIGLPALPRDRRNRQARRHGQNPRNPEGPRPYG